jgi:starch synthase
VRAGGPGDVVSGLSRELELRGNAVEIILPKYASMRYSDVWNLQPSYHDLQVPWYDGAVRCTVWFGYANGRKCFFIEPPWSSCSGPGSARMSFTVTTGRRDWSRSCFMSSTARSCRTRGSALPSITFRHQGTSDEQVLWATGLGRPDYFLDADRLGDDFRYRGLNPLKGGILYSNFVTTVSPNYADEALYDDGACGLGRILKEQQDKFRGILNGVDYDAWSPETDPYLPDRYSGDSLAGKSENKNALRDRFWLREADGPVVAFVGRLDEQKGMHLVHHALFYTLARGGQFILTGDAHYHDGITDHFRQLKRTSTTTRTATWRSGTARTSPT